MAADASNRAAWAGLACGLIALAVGLLPGWVAPLCDPPSRAIHRQAADWLGTLRDQAAAAAGIGDQAAPVPAPAPNPWRDPRIGLAALLLAFVGLSLAAVAFARREEPRIIVSGLAVAAGAVATQRLLTALLILGFALTAALLSALTRRA